LRCFETLCVFVMAVSIALGGCAAATNKHEPDLAAQLHDELAQGLALCKLKLATLLQKHPHLASSIPFAHVQETLDEVLSATRHVMSDLRPAFMGDTRDVAAAVQWAVKKVQRHGLQVIVRDDGISPHLDEDILTVTYLAVHELLFNVLKHAHSPLASVTITCRASSLRIIVRERPNTECRRK